MLLQCSLAADLVVWAVNSVSAQLSFETWYMHLSIGGICNLSPFILTLQHIIYLLPKVRASSTNIGELHGQGQYAA